VIEAIFAMLFGLLIGSFLNVCIHRWPRGRSVVKPRSHCVRCRMTIPWYDNIPVVSYLVLGGKCRGCGRHISIRYPTVELLTGLVFFFFVWQMGPTLAALKMCIFGAMLIALTFSDLEKRILPDELTLGGTVIGLIFSAIVPVPDATSRMILSMAGVEAGERFYSIAESAAGAFLPAFFLYGGGLLYYRFRKREGLGLGDVKLIAMVGSFLGLQGALLTLILGSVSGSIIGMAYIKLAGKDANTYELPFGTFLGIAALAAAMGAQSLFGWYAGYGPSGL
jgi:leader peptidase (prepilin peptidase) / N-methyltransferase